MHLSFIVFGRLPYSLQKPTDAYSQWPAAQMGFLAATPSFEAAAHFLPCMMWMQMEDCFGLTEGSEFPVCSSLFCEFQDEETENLQESNHGRCHCEKRKWFVASERFCWGFRQLFFYIYLPVSSWGQSCVNCWHVSSIQIQSAENDPSRRCCWGIPWAYLMLLHITSVEYSQGFWVQFVKLFHCFRT